MQELTTEFRFTGRYFKLGAINETTQAVWFVLHGYGQLAQYFLPKFKKLADQNICIIAPEGLSHYYLEDAASRSKTGNSRVGASWMTRENRIVDIENYLTYLNAVFKSEVKDRTDLKITILGFSQGAATVSRWALSNEIYFQQLILWAGILPTDMDFEKGKELLKTKDVRVVYGKNDPFLNDSRMGEMDALTRKLEIEVKPIVFDGVHEMHEQTLLSLI